MSFRFVINVQLCKICIINLFDLVNLAPSPELTIYIHLYPLLFCNKCLIINVLEQHLKTG